MILISLMEGAVSDFIMMNCPSCGGKLQVRKDVQRYFCMYCGMELLLKQNHEGIYSTVQVRDLRASAKLKEIQITVCAMNLLREQIKELEDQIRSISNSLLEFCPPCIYYKYYDRFQREKTLAINLRREYERTIALHQAGKGPDWKTYISQKSFPGYASANELLRFLHFLEKSCYRNRRDARRMISILESVPVIVKELREKKIQLKKLLNNTLKEL